MRSVKAIVAALAAMGAVAAFAEDAPQGITIRTDRPRIMLTTERIEALKDKLASEPIPGKDPAASALKWVLTRDDAAGAEAVAYMSKFDLSDEVLFEKTASDDYRWSPAVPVIYDWCNDRLTPEERNAFLARYGRIVEAMNAKSWGSPAMPGNNYYAGYMRNSGIFGLAGFGETPAAAKALDDALVTRWRNSSVPYYSNKAAGGVTGEGSQYDRYNINYVLWLAEAVKSATGRDIYSETNWFREWAIQTIYSTTAAETFAKGVEDPYYQRFPFGDCEMWQGHPNVDEYIGDSMRAIALEYGGEKLAGYMQAFLENVEPPLGVFGWLVEDGREVKAGDLWDLPLEYYAPGTGYAYVRSGWNQGATAMMLQLGTAKKASHQHLDIGSFQIARAGRWMTKESTGYDTKFAGCTSHDALAHNTVVFDGRGQANAYPDGEPEVIALQTGRDFFHAAVDLTKAYRASKSSHPERDDNPGCARCIREFLYIRPDVLVVFDRLESTSEDVEKTFVLHFPERPKFEEGNMFLLENGGSQFVSRTVYPKDATYKIFDEGEVEGKKSEPGFYQQRVEVSQKGAKQSFFLTVMAAQERFDQPPVCELVESEDTIGCVIRQPGRRCQVTFRKSAGESLGSLVVDAAGAYGHSESNLPARCQSVTVDADGVRWSEPLEKPWPTDPARKRK